MANLLEVKDLKTRFFTEDGVVKAVEGVSFDLAEGETMGLVGESGCGKSVTMMSLLRLIPNPPGLIVGGQVIFEGEDLLAVDEEEMRHVRGNRIAMVFQEPMTSLNPVITVGRQIAESLELHRGMDSSQSREETVRLLRMVGIPDAAGRVDNYPHQFSGGMRQRVMIAMALSCDPKLLIADEPTTAVDVTIQAQLLEIMKKLTYELGTALILVTHNLGIVARYADKVYVMYAGRIIESAPSLELYGSPKHPYTMGLLSSVPRLDESVKEKLVPVEGLPPSLIDLPPLCAFLPRCVYAIDRCREEDPQLVAIGDNHYARCWLTTEGGKTQ